MKKTIILLLMGFVIAGLLTGCKGTTDVPEPYVPDFDPASDEGMLIFKIDLDFQPIKDAAIQYNLFDQPTYDSQKIGCAGDFNIEITISGVNENYIYEPYVSYTLGDVLDKSHIVLRVYLKCFDTFPEGAYVVTLRQIGDWGINFYRQDIANDPTLYFDIPGTPMSTSAYVTHENETLITAFITPIFVRAE